LLRANLGLELANAFGVIKDHPKSSNPELEQPWVFSNKKNNPERVSDLTNPYRVENDLRER